MTLIQRCSSVCVVMDDADKNSSKFTAWLDLDSLTDLRMKQDAIEVVALLAHEIIREVRTYFKK